MKIRPVGAELFHADWYDETDSHFSQFRKRAYKRLYSAKSATWSFQSRKLLPHSSDVFVILFSYTSVSKYKKKNHPCATHEEIQAGSTSKSKHLTHWHQMQMRKSGQPPTALPSFNKSVTTGTEGWTNQRRGGVETNSSREARSWVLMATSILEEAYCGADGGEWSTSRPGRFSHPGKEPRYPLNRTLCRPQSRFGRFGEDKKAVYLLEFLTSPPHGGN